MKAVDRYAPPSLDGPIELQLSRNEGRAPRGLTQEPVAADALSRYPALDRLRARLAENFDLASDRVLVTAGGDDALLRTCLTTLGADKRALVASPTFEMIPRYVRLAGGELTEVEWPEGPFPTEAFLEAADERTAVAFIVSPNNPTGAVATAEDVERIARALPDTLVVLDAAYGEFDPADPTPAALAFENVVVVRTLSKAWGLAGLRVGYVLGPPPWVERLSAGGNPFPVSVASAQVALERLQTGAEDVEDYLRQAAVERAALADTLNDLGARCAAPNRANFVLARGLDPAWTTRAAASLGIALRRFPDRDELSDAVRMTLPGDPTSFERLERALRTILAPEALLFDLDGVLADVSLSYRATILATARSFGADATAEDVTAVKERGNANNDWIVTRTLLLDRGIEVGLEEVTERFEEIYQGTAETAGLRERETLLVPKEVLSAWGERFPLAIVTGRPRADARTFLERFDLGSLFSSVICAEDAPAKPDPTPVRLALEGLGVRNAWMLGDTRDDLDAARAAGVLPIAVVPGGLDSERTREHLRSCGAARVLDRTIDLQELLP